MVRRVHMDRRNAERVERVERAPKSDSVPAATPELPGLMATFPSSRRGDVGLYTHLVLIVMFI
jgi:hypothetical protein